MAMFSLFSLDPVVGTTSQHLASVQQRSEWRSECIGGVHFNRAERKAGASALSGSGGVSKV